ncbi:MAG: hypothetical protein ACYS9X_25155, partial [Planctomycetota bacterium]
MRLHWSYDYDYHHQLSFRDALLAALASYRSSPTGGDSHTYAVLPNYWNGYRRDVETLAFGEAVIDRTAVDGGIGYECSYRNEASGESLRLEFRCRDGLLRELLSPWKVTSRNDASSLYDSFSAEGRVIDADDGRRITLRVGPLDVPAGIVDEGTPLVCNWSLFDVIPYLEEPLDFTMIDDLEKLRAHSR